MGIYCWTWANGRSIQTEILFRADKVKRFSLFIVLHPINQLHFHRFSPHRIRSASAPICDLIIAGSIRLFYISICELIVLSMSGGAESRDMIGSDYKCSQERCAVRGARCSGGARASRKQLLRQIKIRKISMNCGRISFKARAT